MTNFETEIKFNKELSQILDNARERFIPIMLNSTARFLWKTVNELNVKDILEVGTAVGYSGALMLKASENSFLTTIEIDKERSEESKQNFKKLGLEDRVTVINEDGDVALEKLIKQNKKYDFILLDGPKGQYKNYFQLLENLMDKTCVIFIDDVLYGYATYKEGEVEHKHRAMMNKLRDFVKFMQNNQNYKVQIFNIDEGIMLVEQIQ